MYPNVQKILNVMSNQNVTFFIPPYQRNYEWTDEQCTVFLEDIKKLLKLIVSERKQNIFLDLLLTLLNKRLLESLANLFLLMVNKE